MHSTNYYNTLIEKSEDCTSEIGKVPLSKGKNETIAEIQFRLLKDNPYRYTSDELLFEVFAIKNEISAAAYEEAKTQFFSKGQPCMRCSPLVKNYGWGVHANADGKIALIASETEAYKLFVDDAAIKKVKGMKSKK